VPLSAIDQQRDIQRAMLAVNGDLALPALPDGPGRLAPLLPLRAIGDQLRHLR